MVKTSLAIALVSGAALSSGAFAQDLDFIPKEIKSVNGRPYVAQPFSDRAPGLVYDSSSGRCVTLAVPAQDIMDDLNFAVPAGPWTGKRNNLLTNVSVRNFVSLPSATPDGLDYTNDNIVFFWRGINSSLVANVQQDAEPLGGFRVNFAPLLDDGLGVLTNGSGVYGAGVDVTAFGLVLPTDGSGPDAAHLFIEQLSLVSTTNNLLPRTAAQRGVIGRRTAGTTPGGSAPEIYIDIQGATEGVFEGGPTVALTGTATPPNRPVNAVAFNFTPTPGFTTDHFTSSNVAGTGTCAAGSQNYFPVILSGELGVAPPTPISTTTTVTDAGATVSGSVIAAGVTWHKIIINGDATDWARQFLDVTATETTGDIAMALYDENGNLTGVANGTADTNTAVSNQTAPSRDQLSYGIGRRAAPANGIQMSGQSGQLFAGTFYLAVAGRDGALSFGSGFVVSNFGGSASSYSLRFDTNVNGTPLDPPVEPTLIQDLGVLASATGTTGTTATIAQGKEGWYKFQLAADVAACSGGPEFLDIDFSGTSPATADPVSFLFDSSGLALYVSDDRGTTATSVGAFFPAYSFGAVGPRTYAGTNPFDGNYNGSALNLLRGTYYLAIGHFPLDVAVRFGDRFHTRWGGDAAAASFDVAPVFATNAAQVQTNCFADIDTDGDIATGFVPDCGVDINDLLAFLAGFEVGDLRVDLDDDGDPAATTPDGGVDINDLLFFLIVFGGEGPHC